MAGPCADPAARWLPTIRPASIAGRTMDTYHRWMEVTLYAGFAGLPALCVRAGFGGAGPWPSGLQL